MTNEKSKEEVYKERNLNALAFIKAYVETYLCVFEKRPDFGYHEDGDGYALVWVETVQGQVAWHVPMDMVPAWMPRQENYYDGYTTEEKNDRLREYINKSLPDK